MNCAEIELLICDYVDGTLAPAEKAELERHLSACPACAELAGDGAAAVAFMARVAEVDAPPELVTKILYDAPWTKAQPSRKRSWFGNLLSPILQPKFAMGMAMTILSLSMLAKFVVPVRQLRPSDLRPSEVWAGLENRATRVWARSVKFYENLKFVYQIQSTLREWQQQDDERQAPAPPKIDERKLPVNSNSNQSPAVPGGAPASSPPVSH